MRLARLPVRLGLAGLIGLAASALPAQPAGGFPLDVTGTLVDERGEAMAGVEVLLRPYPSRFELDIDVLGVPEALPEAVDRTRSEASGAFTLKAPVPGPYRFEIRPAPPEEEPAAVVPLLYGNLTPLDASQALGPTELPSRHRVEVRVRDADDRPIENALVVAAPTTLRSARSERTDGRAAPRRTYPRFHRGAARTNAEGSVRFLMPTAEAEVAVAAPGFAISARRTERGRVVLRLERDPGVRVRVRNPNDTPAPAILVRTHGETSLPLALTDEQGQAVVSGILAPDTAFEFERFDHALVTASPPDGPATGQPTDETTLDVRLDTATRISGRVLDRASGAPVGNATVWSPRFPGHATSSDPAGGFDLSTRPSETNPQVHAPGYVSAWVDASAERPDRDEVSVFLQPAAPLFGVITDAAKRPVAGASIGIVPFGADSVLSAARRVLRRRSTLPAASGADGAFFVADAEYDVAYRLTIRAAGFPNTVVTAPPLEQGATAEPLEIVLTRGRRTSGRIVDTEGSPVVGAEVRLRQPPETDQDWMFRRLDAAGPTTTDEQGGFRLPAVVSGEYELRIVHTEYPSTGNRMVDVPEGDGEHDLGDFTLAPGAELFGFVSGPDDQPVEGASVEVPRFGSDRDQERATTTDSEGRFRLGGLPHELVYVSVRAAGFAPAALRRARPGTDEPILIQLEAGATLTGRVVDDAGNPVADVSVRLDPDEETRLRTGMWSSADFMKQTGSDGAFRFGQVSAGTWSVEATEGETWAKLDGVELAEGAERHVELELRLRDQLIVVVTTPAGEPLAEAQILVRPEADLFASNRGATDASGRAQIGVTPGVATVETSHEQYQDDSRKVVLEPGSNELAVRLGTGGAIAGVVRSADGAPLPAASVEAHSEEDVDRPRWARRYLELPRTISDREGRFRIGGLEPGTYFVVGQASGFAADGPEQPLVIDGQTVDGVEVLLEPGGSIVGTVTGLDSTQLANVGIEVSQGARWRTTAPDPEGRFHLEHMAPGTWKVLARRGEEGRGGRSVERTATLGQGASETFVELPFEHGLRLSGQVFLAGEPLARGSVAVVQPGTGIDQWVLIDHLGRFAMDGLEVGPHELRISQPGGSFEQRALDLHSDLEDLRIDLERPGSVAGIVVDEATGQRLGGAQLAAGDARQIAALRTATRTGSPVSPGVAGSAFSHGAGRFELEFGPGADQLLVTRDGYRDVVLPLAVPPGQRQTGLVIRLQPETSEPSEQ